MWAYFCSWGLYILTGSFRARSNLIEKSGHEEFTPS